MPKEGQEINKFKFKNNKKIKTLFKSNDFNISRIYSYTHLVTMKKNIASNRIRKIYRYSSKSIFLCI